MRLRRAISLVPSATDTLVAIGAGEALVGISSDCDQPDPRSPVPVVAGAVVDPAEADPAAIDAAVRERLGEGRPLYELDVEAIVALAPDVVFAQDRCAVCAVPSGEVTAALAGHGLSCEVVSLDPVRLDDVLSSFARIGHAAGAGEAGEALESSCRQRLGDLGARWLGYGRPRVLVLDWVDPPFAAGNWVPELVEAAGGAAAHVEVAALRCDEGGGGGRLGSPVPSRQLTVDDVIASAPEVVVVAPCGLGLDASATAGRVVKGWFGARAADASSSRGGGYGGSATGHAGGHAPRVVAFDGRIWFSRPGPRLVEGAEALSAVLRGTRTAASGEACDVVEITRG